MGKIKAYEVFTSKREMSGFSSHRRLTFLAGPSGNLVLWCFEKFWVRLESSAAIEGYKMKMVKDIDTIIFYVVLMKA